MAILLWRSANLNLKSSEQKKQRKRESTHMAFWCTFECIYKFIQWFQTFRRLCFVMQFRLRFSFSFHVRSPSLALSIAVFLFLFCVLLPFLVHTIFVSLCMHINIHISEMIVCFKCIQRYFIDSTYTHRDRETERERAAHGLYVSVCMNDL